MSRGERLYEGEMRDGALATPVRVSQMMQRVVKVAPLPKCRLHVELDNGVSGTIDLSGELDGEVFQPLRDGDTLSCDGGRVRRGVLAQLPRPRARRHA
jgi:hypothetical protein